MKYRTRTVEVEAYHYDGTNLARIETLVGQAVGTEVHLDKALTKDSWVVISGRNWQALSETLFRRLYERSGAAQTCFDCTHYGQIDGRGRCSVFEEDIDSEVLAGSDCDAYDEEPR